MRTLALLLLAALLLPPIWLREPVPVAPPGVLLAIPLPTGLPSVVDGFTREALWQLDSPSDDFGGYSAMLVPGGGRLQLFSDRGTWLTLATADGRIGRPAGRLPFPRVRDIGPFSDRYPDIESATRDPATGQYWLGFESFNAIARYSSTGALQAVEQPPAMRSWPMNSGIEAMARLVDGRFIVLPEHRGPGLLFAADPSAGNPAIAFRFDLPDPYYATDLAQLPDGRLLVLVRGTTTARPCSAPCWSAFCVAAMKKGASLALHLQAAATAFFSSRALVESFSSLVLSSQLSRPPLCSTERRPWVDTRNLKLRSSFSEISVTFCRLGRKTRLVLLLAWLTLWPTWRPLPVSSQMRDMAKTLSLLV
jgi:hypothetical protein